MKKLLQLLGFRVKAKSRLKPRVQPTKTDSRVRRANGQIARKIPVNQFESTIGYIYL